jgi:hypothetical protein
VPTLQITSSPKVLIIDVHVCQLQNWLMLSLTAAWNSNAPAPQLYNWHLQCTGRAQLHTHICSAHQAAGCRGARLTTAAYRHYRQRPFTIHITLHKTVARSRMVGWTQSSAPTHTPALPLLG